MFLLETLIKPQKKIGFKDDDLKSAPCKSNNQTFEKNHKPPVPKKTLLPKGSIRWGLALPPSPTFPPPLPPPSPAQSSPLSTFPPTSPAPPPAPFLLLLQY